MPRPRKWRRVCCLPENTLFGPQNGFKIGKILVMTVEEFETIRLIDLEGLTQEACAERMEVARTTVQWIYNDARKKLAVSLVEGHMLKIEGGDYQLYDRLDQRTGCARCRKHRLGQFSTGDKEN